MKTNIESRSLGESKGNYNTNASIRQMRQSDLSEQQHSSTHSTGSNYGNYGSSQTDYRSSERDAMGYRVHPSSGVKHKDKMRKGVTGGQIAAGVIAGASLGVIAGILLAPEKGRDLRKQVKNSATRWGGKVTQGFNSTKDKVSSWTNKSDSGSGTERKNHYSNLTSQSSTEVNTTNTDPALGPTGGTNMQRCL